MKKNRIQLKKIIIALIIIIALPLVLECFLFNFRSLESFFFRPIDTGCNAIGMEDLGNGSFEVTDPDNAGLEFSGINAHVDSVYLDINCPDGSDTAYSVNIYMTDAGHALYTKLSDTEIVPKLDESKYIRVHLQGDSEKISIRVNNLKEGQAYDLKAELNSGRPFIFRWWRVIALILLFGLIYFFRPGSPVYGIIFNAADIRQLLVTGVFIIASVVVFSGITYLFRIENRGSNDTWEQYSYLAQSLSAGHTYLDIEPPAALAEMEDPYDCALRAEVLEKAGETYVLDYAYFDGKYYCYFGVVPVLLFYLPYLMLTGKALSTAIPMMIAIALFIAAAFWFIAVLIRRFFPQTSFGLYILLSCVLVAGSGLTYGAAFPVIYSLPITLGIAFDLLGISCWLSALKDDGKLRKAYLLIGALFIALVIGCRPQLAIAVFLAFPIFRKQIRDRQFFSVKGLGNTLCIIAPFLIIGIGAMYYNHVRFGSPFDFGATYNLTGFDMTHRGFDLSRFGIGFFEYLFQPFRVALQFPYVFSTSPHLGILTDYQGEVMNETFFGGFFFFNIFGAFIFRFAGCGKDLKKKGLFSFTLFNMIFGLIIMAVDIQMVGIIYRYLTDFSMFLLIPAVIIALSLMENMTAANERRRMLVWIVTLSMLTIAVNYYILIAADRPNSLYHYNPLIYYKFKYQLFSFLSIR